MIGAQIGNYRITATIGRGGMGEVHSAEHVSRPGIRVAIKTLLPDISSHRAIVERFFNEANAVSMIKHAGIVRIFDLGYHGDRAYLVMELLEGDAMATTIRRGAIPIANAIDYGRQAASAIYAAHAASIIHRDLKPDNLFLVDDHELPSGKRVKVLDFGIAKLSDSRTQSGNTSGAMGTPAYMPPEQWQNAASVDARSDIYALGGVLHEMLTGRPPFPGQTLPEYCTQHLTWPAPSARAAVPSLPPDLDALITAMLAKDPAQRPQSMHDIDLALGVIQEKRGLRVVVDKRRLSQNQRVAAAPAPGEELPHQTTLSAAAAQPARPSLPSSSRRRWVALATIGVGVTVTMAVSLSGGDGKPPAPAAAIQPAVEPPPTVEPPPPVKPTHRWIRVEAPEQPVALGVTASQAAAGDLGFRPPRVEVSPQASFEIQQHEVTWSEIEPWLADASHVTQPIVRPRVEVTDPGRTPATGIPWEVAGRYCESLGGSLPTENQWELAARGPTLRRSVWGNAPVDPAAIHAYQGPDAAPGPVMARAVDRTAAEIHDLAGNAQEWTADRWTEDDSDRPPPWASENGRVHVAVRGLPMAIVAPAVLPAVSGAYRDALCAGGPCPTGTAAALAAVGFRCVRPVP